MPMNEYDRKPINAIGVAMAARARVRSAQRLLETTRLDVEQVAADCGFGSASVLRQHFAAVVGTSPLAYRRAFSRSLGSQAQ